MPITVDRVRPDEKLPAQTQVVVVGAGIIGVSAALALAEKGIPTVLCEKGEVAAEQSSRNWGFCRTALRDPREIALSLEAQRMWEGMDRRIGEPTGFTRVGTLFTCETEAEMAARERWLEHAYRTHGRAPFVLLDPPRTGLPAPAMRGLLRLRPQPWEKAGDCSPPRLHEGWRGNSESTSMTSAVQAQAAASSKLRCACATTAMPARAACTATS